MVLPHSSVFAAVLVIVGLSVPIAAYWKFISYGQRIYLITVASLIATSFLYIPFKNPTNSDVIWGFAWDPPTYRDEDMAAILTPSVVEDLKETEPDISPEFVENSVLRPMNAFFWRYYVWPIVPIAAIGSLFLPGLIDYGIRQLPIRRASYK